MRIIWISKCLVNISKHKDYTFSNVYNYIYINREFMVIH